MRDNFYAVLDILVFIIITNVLGSYYIEPKSGIIDYFPFDLYKHFHIIPSVLGISTESQNNNFDKNKRSNEINTVKHIRTNRMIMNEH